MRLNEKNVASFAVCSSPVDKEGYLQKKGDLSKDIQRRWFVLKGNLLFYFQKKQDKEPLGVIVLEACSVQVSSHGRYSFEISFDGVGTRTYVLYADNDEEMQSWIKAISHASYEYLRSIVSELQRRVNVLTSSSKQDAPSDMTLLHVGPPKASLRVPTRSQSEKVSPHKPDGGNPLAITRNAPTVRVRRGILVDIESEEAPPIPAKQSHTTQFSRTDYKRHTVHSSHTEHADFGLAPDSHKPPHSSPLIPSTPISNSQRPLSPPSTLDRTPVLQPTQKLIDEEVSHMTPTLQDPQQNQSESSCVQLGERETRQVTAPLNNKKSIYEMHEEFTEAIRALKNERK